MKLITFSPLLTLPIATFVNLQSFTVPLVHNSNTHSTAVLILSSISLAFGILGTISLSIRMLEKKIKWMTRLMMIGSFLQGILALLSLILFHALEKNPEESYTEAIVYKSIAGVGSIAASIISLYNYLDNLNHRQVYVWVSYGLSNEQRQFILLTNCSLAYMSLVSGLYCLIEKWAFDKSLYWCVSTFLTIGFGDITPKTWLGMFLFPPLSFLGVLVLGSNIYAMRNLFLEGLAVQLASQYSKFVQLEEEVEFEIQNRYFSGQQAGDPSRYSDGIDERDRFGSCYNNNQRENGNLEVLPEHPTDRPSKPMLISERSPRVHPIDHWIENHQLGVSLDSTFGDQRVGSSRAMDAHRKSVGIIHNSDNIQSLESDFALPPSRMSRHSSFQDAPRRRNLDQRTMTISRSSRLPSVTIVANKNLKQKHILKATRDAIIRQTIIAIIILWLNILFGASIFAFYEKWSFGEGLYFSYCSILTIGFGDYVLKSFISRTIFIWFIFVAIGSSTYLISMMSELAFDQWKVTEESIAKRVDRYETKARWKKKYASPSLSPSRGRSRDQSPKGKGKQKAIDKSISSEKPRAYSVSLTHTPTISLNATIGIGKGHGQDQENVPLLPQEQDRDLEEYGQSEVSEEE